MIKADNEFDALMRKKLWNLERNPSDAIWRNIEGSISNGKNSGRVGYFSKHMYLRVAAVCIGIFGLSCIFYFAFHTYNGTMQAKSLGKLNRTQGLNHFRIAKILETPGVAPKEEKRKPNVLTNYQTPQFISKPIIERPDKVVAPLDSIHATLIEIPSTNNLQDQH